MDNRGANIDVVFRNGLKDYEVLPPQEVWDDIRPVIRKKQRPFILLRIAAVAAVVLSLGILAYRLSNEISSGIENQLITLNPESVLPSANFAQAIIPVPPVITVQAPVVNIMRDDQPVSPVATDNLNTTIQDFAVISAQADLKKNSGINYGQYDLPAIDFNTADYMDFDEGTTLNNPDNIIRKEPGKWSISALVSPTFQSRLGAGDNEAIANLMASEEAVMSYSGGLALAYKVSKRLSIQSGVYYSSIGKELTGISAYSGFEDLFYTKGSPNFKVLTSNGTVSSENNDIFLTDRMGGNRVTTASAYNNNVFDPEKASLKYIDNSLLQNFSFLELPVILRYKIIDKTLDFNIIGGISSNLLVNNSVYASAGDGKLPVGKTEGLNILTFSSSLGMGMEYNISYNFSLNLEPTFRYYINPFNDISSTGIHPYSFGVFSGISYRF
jgi:hypothetical protein